MTDSRIIVADVLDGLRTLPDGSVHCVVTSPPYWGLRDYGCAGQIGLEATPELFVAKLVEVFREVRRVLRGDGTLWLNMGDSYAAGKQGLADGDRNDVDGFTGCQKFKGESFKQRPVPDGLKPKDLVGIPWRVAFALQADGWYLRQDIIWHKPNPIPESVTDRCTKSHEYLFLLAKSDRYYYDAKAVAEPSVTTDTRRPYGSPGANALDPRGKQGEGTQRGKGGRNAFRGQGHFRDGENGPANRDGRDMRDIGAGATRNRRSVWTIPTAPYRGAHFATFPPALVRPCILAGCPVGGTVLDPFLGSGTTAAVAVKHGRRWIGIELSPAYAELARKRIAKASEAAGLFLSPPALEVT